MKSTGAPMPRVSYFLRCFLATAGFLLALSPEISLADYNPPPFTGTGAYRRVYSHSAYSYVSANVYLPGSNAISLHGGDTPYVYTGGWGLNGAGAVDAGFQYSPTFNDWSLFASGEGVGRLDYGDRSTRFAANQTLSLTFAVVQAGANVDLVVTAVGVQVNTSNVLTESLTLVNVAGWSVGGQNTLKRMTSIAQNGDQFNDGSYMNGVVWSNSMIGNSAADATPWLAAQTGGFQSYPTTPGIVNVQFINAGNETDSINLGAVPEPSTVALMGVGVAFLIGHARYRRSRSR
jgi:hypothetical protein